MNHGAAVPEGVPGLEAVWEINGVSLGDRRAGDVYRLTDIDGLADIDVRDSRYEAPSDDGELLGIARYSGRTLSFTGRMEAGNAAMLRKMGRDLSRCTGDLTLEQLLYARTVVPGIQDDFFYQSEWDGHTLINGAKTNFIWERGRVRTTAAVASATTRQTRIDSLYGDADVIAHYIVPSIEASAFWGVTLPGFTSTVLYAGWSSAGLLQIVTSNGTVLSQAQSWSTLDFWIRLRKTGNVIRLELWDEDPTEQPMAQENFAEATLAGADIAQFGSGIRGGAGIRWISGIADERLVMFKVLPRESRDICIPVRKIQAIQRRETQTSAYLRRDFLMAVRASSPMFGSAILQELEIDEVVPDTLGRIYDRTYPLAYTSYLTDTGDPVTPPAPSSAWNYGDSTAQPLYRIYGPAIDPQIQDDLSLTKMEMEAVIADGDYLEIDTHSHKIVDSAGNSQFGARKVGSGWLLLPSGESRLRLISGGIDVGQARNGGFEDSTGGGTVPPGWTEEIPTNVTLTQDTTAPRTDLNHMRLTCNVTNSQARALSLVLNPELIDGGRFTLRFWVRNGSGASGKDFSFGLWESGGAGSARWMADTALYDLVTLTDSYQECIYEGQLHQPDRTAVTIYMGPLVSNAWTATSYAFIDDVEIKSGTKLTVAWRHTWRGG